MTLSSSQRPTTGATGTGVGGQRRDDPVLARHVVGRAEPLAERRAAQRPAGGPPRVADAVGQVRVPAGDPLEARAAARRRGRSRRTSPRPGRRRSRRGVPVASSPIAAQAYARRGGRRLSPSLANRLTIGFAIAFAVLTGLAVIGVARFLQQRQDFENATARSYQTEIVARNRLARGPAPGGGAGDDRRRAGQPRQTLRDDIDGQTRDTALLVGAGLIAGLTGRGAALQRPDLLDAPAAGGAGRRLRAASPRATSAPGSRSAGSRRPRRSAPPSTRWPTSCSARPANATGSTG